MRITDVVPTADGSSGGTGLAAAALLPAPVAHIARDVLDPHLDQAALVRRSRRRPGWPAGGGADGPPEGRIRGSRRVARVTVGPGEGAIV